MTCHLPIRPRTQTLFPAPNYSLKIKNGQTNQKGRRKQRGSPIPKTLVFRFNSFPPNSPPDPSSPAIIGCFLAILLPIGRDLLFPLLFTPRSRFAGSVSAMSPGAALMETSKPTDSSAMEARFADLCKNTELALGESLEKQAMILFKETIHILSANVRAIGAGSTDEMERLWSAFVLYSVVRLGLVREKENSGVTLPRILKAAKLKFGDFIKEMPQFSVKAGFLLSGLYDPDWEKKLELKELQASIEHLSLLRRHFKRSYHEYFVPGETSSNHHSISDSAEFMSDYHRFGWLLFLALRVHHFGPFKDLVTCTNGLVSIMAILILHVPARLRKFSIQDSTPFAKKSDKGVNLLASLSDICHTSEDELRITMGKVNKLIVDVLKKKPCPASECKRENLEHIDPDGLMYFEDLLEDNSLQSCLSILEKDYDDVISTKGELDEHMFANDDSCLLGTCSLSGTPLNVSGTKRKFDVFASPSKTIKSPLSPTCSPAPSRNGNHVGNFRVPSTPVSTAMTTAKWLRTVISPLSSTPSAELGRFLSSCDKDVTGDVTRRANIILEAIFPSNYGERCTSGCENMSQMDNSWAERRKMEALKLYYRILEAICRTESHTTNNLSSLLSTERFHRCMLACSAELVLASYKTITMAFPAVLEKTGITAFDLSKMIECFVRHEETLPRELKRHLNYLEERLLESMVWEKGSSMYNSLIVARADLSEEISRLDLLAEPLPSLDVIAMQHNIHLGNLPTLPFHKCDTSPDHNGDAQSPKGTNGEYRTVLVERNSFMSPVKERLLTFNSLKSKMAPLQSVFASPNRRNPAGDDTCGAAGINSFFSKILKLAAIRIRSLCDRLQLSQKILERIYFLIQKIVSHRTALFFNRHIDQIILCCFYGVAKISQLSLTFKDIIYNYKKQSQCKPQVFRSVYVNWPPTSRNGKSGEEHVDIITFYNEIFIPCAKPLLVELGPSDDTKKNNRNHEDKNDADGQIPGSPRFSPFPNLPDMSPKKVSAAHNIYVSPLRSSKMDSMLSPSSKSYYACIGESTHAFQSPSKDLTAINNRLNCGGRKIGGRLNFDMVSDSVVAGSLVPSTANLNNLSAKSEPDSQ